MKQVGSLLPEDYAVWMLTSRRLAVCAIGVWCLAAGAFGQMNSGEITGGVKDPSGAVLPGATIVAEEAGTSLTFTASSNQAGEYLLARLPVGSYSIRVNAPNFKQSVLSKIDIHVGERLRYDFTLQLGDANQEVVVEATGDQVQQQSAEIRDVIANRPALALPSSCRQFLDLLLL